MSKSPAPPELTLRHPVTVEGNEYSSLVLRRALARDSRDAQRGGGTPAEIEMRMFSNLCEVSPKVIEELDLGDYLRLQERFQAFLES